MNRVVLRSLFTAAVVSASASVSAAAGPVSALLKLPSGVTLHYVVQGEEGGEPIVLLHGLGDSWHSWELVLPHVPERYRVYALSLRGHGWSDAPERGYAQEDFAADVSAFMQALKLRGVTLVGHSLGSFVAQVVAERDTGQLKRLVLIGSGPGGAANASVQTEIAGVLQAMRTNPRTARDFEAGTVARPVPATFFETMVASAAAVPAHVWAQVGAAVHNPQTAAGLSSVKIPTLLIWGDRDALVLREDQDALLARLPNARLVVYPETGHSPHWEQTARFVVDLIAFLQP